MRSFLAISLVLAAIRLQSFSVAEKVKIADNVAIDDEDDSIVVEGKALRML